MRETTTTLADLNGHHIGKVIVVQDGGATYTGELRKLHHDCPIFESSEQKAFIGIESGEWRHHAHYPATTPVRVLPDEENA